MIEVQSPAAATIAGAGALPCSSLRDEFYSRLSPGALVTDVFEHLQGVYFFLKDDCGRTIAFNSQLLRRLGIANEVDVIGATDHDLFPATLADRYLDDDRRVLTTGQPLINRVEAWRNEQPVVTSKYPVRDAAGQVIGVMGMFQLWEAQRQTPAVDGSLNGVVDYLRAHLHERVSVEQLADQAFLSPRQLRRKFDQQFGMSIQEFMIKMRVEAAGEALRSSDSPISVIARQHGFCDQAAFTHHFRRRTGMTPLAYRRRRAD